MARFTRRVEAEVEVITPYRLPMKGSNGKAFIEMGFRWRGDFDLSDRLRKVVMPTGFTIEEADGGALVVVDENGYPRATIGDPTGSHPIIAPMKRFKPDVEKVKGGWRMLVREWDKVLVRGAVFDTGVAALGAGTEWLEENKPGWSSYVARVNFRANPPKWKLFV